MEEAEAAGICEAKNLEERLWGEKSSRILHRSLLESVSEY